MGVGPDGNCQRRKVIKGGAGSMRGQSVAVTIYPSPLPSPRPPGIRWTCSSSLRPSANPSLKGNLRDASARA